MKNRPTFSAWPRLMKAFDAARYIGTSETTLRRLVSEGAVAQPLKRGGERVWDIRDLDEHVESLPRVGEPANDGWKGQALCFGWLEVY